MPRKVLDLGGGSGALFIAIAEAYTNYKSYLSDTDYLSTIPYQV